MDMQKTPILTLSSLHANAGEIPILRGIDLTVAPGEIHVVLGPNGAGKSTLGSVIMGHPAYTVTEGSILFDGLDITSLSPDKRANAGLFMSFQNPVEIPGVSLETAIRRALTQKNGGKIKVLAFKRKLEATMVKLGLPVEYAERDLNVSFSGGEKKKSEILQMLMLEPKLAILDETDSGLDVDAIRIVADGINAYRTDKPDAAFLIITHNARLLDTLPADCVHIVVHGRIVRSGDASLIENVSEHGFAAYEEDTAE